ncbi:hypothetical protein [Phaeobacter italicus]|jgi:hypothetical protein|uniref:hypothetical protein n=1 Tax=Phaeobacter italicus TaxID=481446 RepID=UPI002FDE6110
MASAATEAKLAEMIESSRQGYDIIPAFFQPRMGRSNTVSAAIRIGVKRGLIEQSGVDGLGNKTYRMVAPAETHEAPVVAQ